MKKNFFLQLFTTVLILPSIAYSQIDSALTLNATYIGDFYSVINSKIDNSPGYLGLFLIGTEFSTEKLGLWKGGTFQLYGLNTHAETPTGSLVGDIQTFSNAENGDGTFIYQLAYQQEIGKLTVLAGVNDLAANFQSTGYGSLFTNSSFGVNPALSLNMPVSIFPKNALGLVLNYKFTDNLSAGVGFYDGNPGDFADDPYNTNWKLSSDEGVISIAELRYTKYFEEKIQTEYKIGAMYHNADYASLTDASDTIISGNLAVYCTFDQDLFSIDNERHIACFGQFGFAQGSQNLVDLYGGFGLHIHGFLSKKGKGVLGVGVAYASINDDVVKLNSPIVATNETALEFTYKYDVTDKISLQPVFQYIINPGALTSVDNASVGMIRLNINL